MSNQIQRPTCAVKGLLQGGRAMCGRVINGEFCGNSDPCEHKVEQEHAVCVQCNQCMWVGDEDDLLLIGEDYIRHCPACNANDETLMDLTARDVTGMHHQPAPEEKRPPCSCTNAPTA